MPNRLMEKLVIDQLHYCCVYSFFREMSDEGTDDNRELAGILGVTERTIRWHKQQIREGCTTCEHQLRCRLNPILP